MLLLEYITQGGLSKQWIASYTGAARATKKSWPILETMSRGWRLIEKVDEAKDGDPTAERD